MVGNRVSYVMVRKRLLVSFAVFAFFLTSMVGRVGWLQFVRGPELQGLAVEQWNRRLTVQPQRGRIFDRNGNLLAGSATAESIVAIPADLGDIEETARLLAPILEMSEESLISRMEMNMFEVFLKRKVEDEVAQAVKELRLPGIRTTIESKRFYPRGNLASHVLGFAGVDEGLEGIEVYYEEELKGKPGYIIFESDARGRELPDSVQAYLDPINGYDLVLTIDEVIQHIAERELDKAMEEFAPKAAGVLAVNPQTGEVLALAARPDFYPERYGDFPASSWRNPLIADAFEPGSTFKIVTMSAALEENEVSLHDGYFCSGGITVSGTTLHCWHSGHGSQSIPEVVWNSCNPGFVSFGLRLGKERLFNYIHGFGFGSRTGIDLYGEATGILFNVNTMSNVDLGVTAFGQGNAVTPIQQVMAAAAVANGGKLMRPYLAKEFRDEDGNVVQTTEPEVIRQVISSDTAYEVTTVLADGVGVGSGRFAAVEGYRVAGKTGTAQKISPDGGYLAGRYMMSYVGFAPAEDPQIALYVMIDEPTRGPQWGGQTAGPVFRDIVSEVMRYWNIPPDTELPRPEIPSQAVVPNLVNLTIPEAQERLEVEGFNLRIEGDGELIIAQTPKPGATVPIETTIVIYTGGAGDLAEDEVTVPSVLGLSMREAGELFALLSLRMEALGSGIAVEQSPQPGARVKSGEKIQVKFAHPD
ncbi:MAG: PASTA domain-containing protein [Firmicutes bacterium]|nr:PASTA domain-containing protein [Bacillota bacterium]